MEKHWEEKQNTKSETIITDFLHENATSLDFWQNTFWSKNK